MTNPNDLIRRGDAVRAAHENIDDPDDAINAIPAAPDTPEVLALVEALHWYAEIYCEGLGECVGDFCGKANDIECGGCKAVAAIAAWEASRDR